MTRPTDDPALAFWEYNLEELDCEIARMAMLCNIRILEPGVIQRVLQKDASVCGIGNSIAFAKLRTLLLIHHAMREKLDDVVGQSAAARVERYVVDRLKQRFPHLTGA